jgi:hypothetical protein
MLGMAWALKLLQAVPQVVAAAPDFKHLWDELVGTFKPHEQQDLKDAYTAAISDAADAHQDLQEIVARHTS